MQDDLYPVCIMIYNALTERTNSQGDESAQTITKIR